MRIDILSAVPEILQSPLSHSIIKRAQDKKLVNIFLH
ncbi:MAG: tRNA (guanosine(37)-N1)-methyltransferase TrmD, partial [Ignavibacteria bacterium]|nr:tRNA (guanosine(37)-N1)-methyltransferase TrmD [Ignavibacteria bacterium]